MEKLYSRKMSKLTKRQEKELLKLTAEIEAEAIQMRLDYEKHPSKDGKDTVVEIHADSDLLMDEDNKLADIAVEIKKKKKEK